MRPSVLAASSLNFLFHTALALNFHYESIQLTEADLFSHNELQFGDLKSPNIVNATCKVYPTDADWPSTSVWEAFNTSLGGALLKPAPLAPSCFDGATYNRAACASAVIGFGNSRFHESNPVSVMMTWPEGNTCIPTANANSTCSMSGFPAYVVNATTVKQIQMAVNFARNQNIRLVIKNSGHDYLGRSVGGGALSIWVHNLKEFEYLPTYTVGQYTGMAARLSAGLQSYDTSFYASQHGITIIAPGGQTVGALGGFIQGGGHSSYTSFWGLAADHVLSIQLVTADGRFITADPTQNQDLFHAVRGGGGGNWGVITSAVVRAFKPVPMASSSMFITNYNVTNDVFWDAVAAYHKHVPSIVDAGALGYNFIRNGPNGTLSFQNSISLPNKTAAQLEELTLPMAQDIIAAGLPFTNPIAFGSGMRFNLTGFNFTSFNATGFNATRANLTSFGPTSRGDGVTNTMMATRLLPRENFEDTNLFDQTMNAIRDFVEAGYTFHGINYAPKAELAPYPGNSSVNPAFRQTVTHAEAWDVTPADGNITQVKAMYDRFNSFVQPWRQLSPSAGSYMNEADGNEPNFQWSFYGENYPRLLQIKQQTDPWGVFYANTGVGSEYWEIKGADLMKTQNGPLCKLAQPSSSWADPSDNSFGGVRGSRS